MVVVVVMVGALVVVMVVVGVVVVFILVVMVGKRGTTTVNFNMLDGGCDPLYVARRVVRMASEDIGNADPRALNLAMQAWDVLERLGSPEGELALAQAVLYLASAAKSNAVYKAYNQARADIKQYASAEVPVHLRNAPTKDTY